MTDPFGLCPEINEAPSKFAFLHTALDIVGVFWEGADLINAGIYLAEGDYENAVISAVSAIPLVGSAVGTGVKLVTKCEKAADLIKVGSKIVGKAGNLALGGETVVNSVKTIATNYSKNKKLFTKENLLCAANAALGVVAGVAAAKGIKSDVKAFKKIAGAEKAAESVTKTSQRVAADAESQLEKTAERTETTNPCTCKGNGQCFVAGTIIKTKDGEKNIEDVEVGDYVLARNPETGEQEYKKVSETFAHKEDVIVHVKIGNEDIQTTFNHPFYVVGKGFVRAGKLEVGDEILTSEGQKISIEKIEIEVLAEPVYVYNFTVEDFHTYFVSELGVWVHNTCPGSKGGSGRTTSENSTILGNNLAREGRAVGEGEAAAHIVASTGSKRQWEAASSSRELLAKYDIDINDAANGIPLGHPRPHNLTHTRAFHEMVNNRLYTVESNMLSKGYGRKAIRSSLRRELRAIGKEFESGIGN